MPVQDIIRRVQSEIEDLTGEAASSWTDPDYILGKLETIGDDIAVKLELLDLNYNTQEVILFNIPPNTEDLSTFQQPGGELTEMIVPKSIEWRLAGQNQEQWTPVPNVDKLVDTDTGTGAQGTNVASDDPTVESYEWRGGKLLMSACSQPIDLRVRFVATAIQLNSNSAQQALGLTNTYVYKCCEKICQSRGGDGVTYFRDCYDRACADFEGLSVKQQQARRFRLGGRRSGNPTGLTGGGWSPPIVG